MNQRFLACWLSSCKLIDLRKMHIYIYYLLLYLPIKTVFLYCSYVGLPEGSLFDRQSKAIISPLFLKDLNGPTSHTQSARIQISPGWQFMHVASFFNLMVFNFMFVQLLSPCVYLLFFLIFLFISVFFLSQFISCFFHFKQISG